MLLYNRIFRTMSIGLYCVLSLVVLLSLVGFRNAPMAELKKEGVTCAFKARIIETVTDPQGRGLVVTKNFDIERYRGHVRIKKGTESEKNATKQIYVLVTDKTKIGYTIDGWEKRFIDFDDLKIDMSVLIEGIRVLKKVDDQEIIVVLAETIEPVE
jgi:hypothetical protein